MGTSTWTILNSWAVTRNALSRLDRAKAPSTWSLARGTFWRVSEATHALVTLVISCIFTDMALQVGMLEKARDAITKTPANARAAATTPRQLQMGLSKSSRITRTLLTAIACVRR